MEKPEEKNNAGDGSVESSVLFSPFADWGDGQIYGLSAQDGVLTTNPDEDRDWTEWHIVKYGGGIYEIEVAEHAETCEIVYRGKIPSNGFLRELLTNLETPPPLGGENSAIEAKPKHGDHS